MIKPNFSQNERLSLDPKDSSNSLKVVRWKTSLFLLSTAALLVPSLPLRAEIVRGIIKNYSPQNQQATISLGEEDDVGKYDRGKIQLTSLDSPNTKFIGANVTVISVEENSAVVSVREVPGIQVPIQAGTEVVLDTDSGLAQREEEAKVIATQQAEEARRQQQLEEARAEQARRQREAEQARAEEARRQREAEEARIIEARRQQQLEAERTEQARQQQQQAEAEAATTAQPDIASQPDLPSQAQPDKIKLEEAEDLWNSEAKAEDVDKLPSDYLLAYTSAREQPSPESYYKFAQVLINYEIFDKASEWLEETKVRFPETATVNNLYRAVALIEQGDIEAGSKILATTNLPQDPLTNDFKTYSYINQGQWDKVLSLSNTKTAASYNNNLIALYCRQPFTFDRETNLPPGNCPLPHQSFEIKEQDYNNDEEFTEVEQNERHKQAVAKLAREAIAAYPEDPYILNTLGFIALQSEDYETAYDRYQELSKLLALGSKIPPRFQIFKANAEKYAANYSQNHDFLARNTSDLASQRSEQDSVTDAVIIGGVGSTVLGVLNDAGPVGIAGGLLSAFLGMNKSKSKSKSIEEERNSVLDQMQVTFTEDMNLVPTPPELEANLLLKLTSRQADQRVNLNNN
ncbi:tetratricopeptide repeat protein [Pleurocapsa sp. FMAR1]|uniref:tetratricopeptide repeat protein n=1 Tax=Pleurocapsa sp. FMAR1 TaxID=3040204 RepID=UPI0029C68CA0|nr:hypothetical protein [Pleurocapsa sp. FMAR1]